MMMTERNNVRNNNARNADDKATDDDERMSVLTHASAHVTRARGAEN